MGSGHRLFQDQNISQKARGIAVARTRQLSNAVKPKAEKAAASKAANATVTEWKIRHLVKVADGLDAVIGKCMLEAEVEAVHRLRTGSRRVQATVETLLRQAGAAGKPLAKPAKAWLRAIRNIRRAAGPVRNLDVHRKLLGESLARWTPEKPANMRGTVAENADLLVSQGKRLDDWLKDHRHARAGTLRKKIKKARQKLEQRRAAFQLAFECAPDLPAMPGRSPGLAALEDFARVVDAMPALDSGNLHDFRKLTKKARYVAESGEEPSSQAIAKALKRVQDAIGEWHDWQSLAGEAKIALEKDGDELTAWLEGQAKQCLTAALRITGRVRRQLLGEWMAARSERRAGRAVSASRKPPARASQTRGSRQIPGVA